MNLTVFFDHTFIQDRHGRIFSPGGFNTAFWKRYLQVFENVAIVSRVRLEESPPRGIAPADGDHIRFAALPPFLGPWAYWAARRKIRAIVERELTHADAVILRIPSTIGSVAWRMLHDRKQPFGVEVVADPAETLARGGVRGLLRPIARFTQVRAMRNQCRDATAAAYVSRDALQRVYPPGNPDTATHYSSIELSADEILDQPRTDFSHAHRLVQVGTLETLYKAPDVLVHALALCKRPDLKLTFVGDGRRRPEVEQLVVRLNLTAQVTFAGRLPAGRPIRDILDRSDLFVLPSRTEGLPKAMIEAMARGVPCVGTSVGGIPELLPHSMLVKPDDAAALAAKILEVLANSDLLRKASQDNLVISHQYTSEVLNARRVCFYNSVAAAARTASRA